MPRYCAQGRGPSGTRRSQQLLAQEGLRGSRRRIGRLRTHAGWRGTTRRRFKAPSAAGQAQPGAPNPRNRACTVHAPPTISVGDITDLPPGEGWLSLAGVLALGSRAVGGWAMAAPRRAAWVHQARARAIWPRQPAAGLIMHTDRGRQYGADSSQQLLPQHGRAPRMSRQGTCGDHAVAESGVHTVQTA